MTCSLVGREIWFHHGRRPVLRGVSVAATPGKVTVIVGPNGSGKTTLLWVMAGLLPPARGEVGVAGILPATPLQPARFAPGAMGMVFQQPALWDHLSAEEHLRLVLAGRRLARREREDRIDAMLESLRLAPLRSRRPGRMSGGQRQRLAIARAMVCRPEWLLLDEPLAHLDGPAREELLELLAGAMAGSRAGVLMTSHNPEETLRLAHEVLILQDGSALQSGPAMEVYHHPASLAAALALGPAAEVRGEARQGNLVSGGAVVIENIDPRLDGSAALVLRPEHVEFLPAAGAPAAVRACQWAGGRYRLSIQTAAGLLPAYSPVALPEGTTGRLRCATPPATG